MRGRKACRLTVNKDELREQAITLLLMANLVQMTYEWLSPNACVHCLIDDLAKRLHHELAFVHVRVRNNKVGFVHV